MSMRFQGKFETIKVIEQSGKVRCCTDDTEGQLLMNLITKEEFISKDQLWKWLDQLCCQIDSYHRCYHRAYQYINPYAILITKDNLVKLLDLETQENEMILIYMQKAIIRESFSRNGNIKKTKVYTDFYSLGKTLQFILAQGNINPSINAVESYVLSKTIKKCLEEPSEIVFQNIKEIQSQLPKSKNSRFTTTQNKKSP